MGFVNMQSFTNGPIPAWLTQEFTEFTPQFHQSVTGLAQRAYAVLHV